MKQGSKQWHDWRSTGIGASEVPILTGSSPHDTTIEELIQKKLTPSMNLKSNNIPKFITDQAEKCEKHCIDLINEKKGLNLTPKTFVHPIYPFIKSSLDGWDEKTQIIVEVKMCKRDYFDKVKEFDVPQHFKDQVLYQMFCTGSFKAFLFAVLFDGKRFNLKVSSMPPVQYDAQRTNFIIKKVFETWSEIGRRKRKRT